MSHSIKNPLLQDKISTSKHGFYMLFIICLGHPSYATETAAPSMCCGLTHPGIHTDFSLSDSSIWLTSICLLSVGWGIIFFMNSSTIFPSLPGVVMCPSKCASTGYWLLCSTHHIALKCLFVDLFRWSISSFRDYILLTIISPVYTVWKTGRVLIS